MWISYSKRKINVSNYSLIKDPLRCQLEREKTQSSKNLSLQNWIKTLSQPGGKYYSHPSENYPSCKVTLRSQ